VRAAAALVGAHLGQDQIAALARYRDLLLEWNQRINLTAIREPAAVERLHLVDALGLLRVVSQAELAGARLADIGTGAGLPGIPLAIIAPGLRLTLIEATGKKVAFLQAAIDTLGLPGVEALHGRAEELAHRIDLRERFHLVTARALAEMPALLELCLPFCRLGGRVLAAKKTGIDAEIVAAGRALRELGGEVLARTPLALPGLEDRQVVVVGKVRPTPPAYPRRPGLPAKQPLL
jgi:16S rRNA (guanine527-N7)-methyltransferase